MVHTAVVVVCGCRQGE